MTISKTAAQVITTVSLVGILGGGCGSAGAAKYLSAQPEVSEYDKFNITMSGSIASLALMGGILHFIWCWRSGL